MPAIGERALAERIFYGIPDVLGADRGRYAGKRVLVVGSGHSAFNALLDLAELAQEAPAPASPGLSGGTRLGNSMAAAPTTCFLHAVRWGCVYARQLAMAWCRCWLALK